MAAVTVVTLTSMTNSNFSHSPQRRPHSECEPKRPGDPFLGYLHERQRTVSSKISCISNELS